MQFVMIYGKFNPYSQKYFDDWSHNKTHHQSYK